MKIGNIKQDMKIKNYKELCKLLEINEVTSDSKKAQLKELERYCKYHKEGQKFIIDEIYDEPKEKIDNRGGNNKVFSDDIEKLILHLLSTSKDECVNISRGKLYKTLNMINDNYLDARRNIPKLSELVELPKEFIYEFYDTSNVKLRGTIERNLRRLRSKALIMWELSTTVAKYEVVIEQDALGLPMTDSKGRVKYSSKITHKVANEEEKKLILEIEREILESENINDLQEVFLKGKWKWFKTEVNNRLRSITNIQYYYDTYTITFNNDNVKKELTKLNYCEKLELEKNINQNMVSSIKNSNSSKFKKNDITLHDEYLLIKENLTDLLIDDEALCVNHDLSKLVNVNNIKTISNKENDDWNNNVPF